MRYFLWISLAAVIILFFGIVCKFDIMCNTGFVEKKLGLAYAPQELPFKKGEKIIYNVKLFGIKIGRSELLFAGKTLLDKKPVELIILNTDVTNLKDTEKIYVENETFLPIKVERSVIFFGRKLQIVEDYNIKENSLTITEKEGNKTTTQVFKSEKPIQNIISLIFLFRKTKDLDIGQKFEVSVPLLNLEMYVTKLVDFDTANSKYKAYLLESEPKKIRFWLDQSQKRIPLRVDGAVGFGNTAMIMTKYIPGEN